MKIASLLALLALAAVGCGDEAATGGPGGAGEGAGAEGGAGAGGAAEGGAGEGGGVVDPPEVAEAIAACYETLHGDVSGRDAALAALQQATEQYPDNGRAHLFLGMCSLAALAEDGDLGALGSIEPALERAVELMPDDLRIPGWLATVRVQTARLLGTEAEVQAAVDEMIAAADLYPAFNNVSLAIAFAGFPLETGYPQMAVDRLVAIQDCGEVDEKCRDNEAAPHNVPGSAMLFGDVHARVGDAEQAAIYYGLALEADSAATWPFAADAQSMLDGLDARVAAWTDLDDTNDPEFFVSGLRTCTGCHQ